MMTLEEYMQLPYRLEIVPDTAEDGFSLNCVDDWHFRS